MAMTSVSRYSAPGSPTSGSFNAAARDGRVSSSESGTRTGAQQTNTSQQQSGITQTEQVQNTNQTTQNMTPATMKALERLIAQLASGGTPEMQAQAAQRQDILDTTRANAAGYTKQAAFADAQGLISQQMRRTLESLLPSINRAAEDAGSSGGALRALLLQDAANKAAESSSALGVQTAVNYGNIQTNFSQVLEAFSRNDPKATEMLLSALNVAKGAVQNTQGTTTTNGTQTTNTNTTGSQSQSSIESSNANKNTSTDYAPFQVTANTGLAQYGQPGVVDSSKYVGTTADFLAELAGNNNPWAGYQI